MLTALLVPGSIALAREEPEAPIVTDRPDFTESAEATPVGWWQIEMGATWAEVAGEFEDGDEFSLPETLARWGFREGWELRLGVPDYVDGIDASGVGDASIGLKYELGEGAGGQWAVIAETSLPTGDVELTSDEYDPAVILIYGRDLADRWSLGTQVGVVWATDEGERERSLAPTIVFGRPLSERWGTFFEIAAQIPENGSSTEYLHHGYTYSFGPHRQWDIHAAIDLDDKHLLIGTGFSFRF